MLLRGDHWGLLDVRRRLLVARGGLLGRRSSARNRPVNAKIKIDATMSILFIVVSV